MASLDDILTTQKNGVVALSGIGIALLRSQGTLTSATVSASTLIIAGKGRIVNFSVVVAGSTVGTIYNSATTAAVAAANALCAIPSTVGVFQTGQNFSNGLVVVPGTGQSINVTYAIG
jgi:hypothetical protein